MTFSFSSSSFVLTDMNWLLHVNIISYCSVFEINGYIHPVKACRLQTRGAIAFGILTTVIAAIAFWRITRRLDTAIFIACPGIAFTVMLWLGSEGVLENLTVWVHRKPAGIALVPGFLWALYLVYAAGMGIADNRAAGAMALY